MTADKTPTVVEALAAVMAEVGAIGKNRVNEQQRFKFRGIDDVLNSLHGPLARHGVLVFPQVQERLSETRETSKGGSINVVHLRVRFVFHGPAGDHVEAETWGEAQDSADKATNKALSAAFKYAMLQVFCIPTDDLEDADRTTVEAAPRPRQPDALAEAKRDVWQAWQQMGGTSAVELADAYAQHNGGLILADAQVEQLVAFAAHLRSLNDPGAAA